jgi:hypothetical protein
MRRARPSRRRMLLIAAVAIALIVMYAIWSLSEKPR